MIIPKRTLMGFAQQKFRENFSCLDRIPKSMQKVESRWPALERLRERKIISQLDFELTALLLKPFSEVDESVIYFICHLIKASKSGHLCVQIHQEGIYPDISQLANDEDRDGGVVLSVEELAQWNRKVIKAIEHLPKELITQVDVEVTLNPSTPFCCMQSLYYLQRHWVYESDLIHQLRRLLKAFPRLEIDFDHLKDKTQALIKQGKLLKQQGQAILQSLSSTISIISGGPGTGKTYTAMHLINLFCELVMEQGKPCKVILAAPTGKAAAHLQMSLDRVVEKSQIPGFPVLKAMTLHSLLGLNKSKDYSEDSISYLMEDLILVDESSMIDVKLMGELLKRILEGSRVIFLGDSNQLSSVEAGSILEDLMTLSKKDSRLSTMTLNECQRTELRSIIEFADQVRSGEAEKVMSGLTNHLYKGIDYISFPKDLKEFRKWLIGKVKKHFLFDQKNLSESDPLDILKSFQHFCILSPFRRGHYGSEGINEFLLDYFRKESNKEWMAIPIMISENNYAKELFNGETGVLLQKRFSSAESYALFPGKDKKNPIRKIPAFQLPKYVHGYCISVHKSQGSEYDEVLLILPENSEVFGREVFYTGITRAKNHITILGDDFTIKKTILEKKSRLSGIKQRF